MKTLRGSVAWIVLTANVLMLCALSLQVVRLPGGTTVMPKPQLTLADTYVDARNWNGSDWGHHPDLAQRLADAGKTDLLAPKSSSPATAHSSAVPASSSAQPDASVTASVGGPAAKSARQSNETALPTATPAALTPAQARPPQHNIFEDPTAH